MPQFQSDAATLQVSNRIDRFLRFPAVEHCICCLLHLPGYMQGSSPLWGWSVCSEYSCKSDHVLRWCGLQKSNCNILICRNHQGAYIWTKDHKVQALRATNTYPPQVNLRLPNRMLPRCGLHCECDFLCYMLSSVPEWGTTTRSDQSVASHLRIVAHGKFVNFPWQTVLANESISLWKFENLYQIGGWGWKDPAWFSLQNAARYMVSWSKLKPGAYDVIAWLPHTTRSHLPQGCSSTSACSCTSRLIRGE